MLDFCTMTDRIRRKEGQNAVPQWEGKNAAKTSNMKAVSYLFEPPGEELTPTRMLKGNCPAL